ncbi:MAG: membrane protein insertion efficiency factor YidD [Thermodesulfobacteriota bacterium]
MKRVPIFFCVFLAACCAMADSLPSGDPDKQIPAVSTEESGAAALGAVRIFQRYVSPIDGDRCPMYPSCSAYSREALEKNGLLLGWIMTCDRLLRCGRDECQTAPRVMVNDRFQCYDPVERNDFWWTQK